ncbi:DUF1772 domain-containing protein [Amycolatopsis rubida]|uniref:Uncharacterized membrane protein n=1 Tax=Amycolatopsis rubida TaxID=112413 RepID=A0A1I5TJ97_9PSEU|nr:DUF1772 domain-containing protein [Amycolatopsis rubida]SFP82737.1 Uncharacterized membrane protein [Amycolatopsis rubida]
MIELLSVVALAGSGLAAGVLLAVALGVVPAFLGLPPDRYVQTHQLVGRSYDRVMPPVVLSTAVLDVALLLVEPGTGARIGFAIATAAMLGVALVSQFGNVPINRVVKAIDASSMPAEWSDPRRRWRGWHLARTWFAMAGLLANGVAVVLKG